MLYLLSWLFKRIFQSISVAGMALAAHFSYLGGVPQVWPLGGCGLWATSPHLSGLGQPGGLQQGGQARGWVTGRAGFWDVLATWVWG